MDSDFAHRKITAAAVAALLRASGFSMSFDELREEFVERAGRQARELKQVLRGMLRNGDLEQDAAGRWYLVETEEVIEGVVAQDGKSLRVNGLEVERERNLHLRAGDTIKARVLADKVQVIEVLSRTDRMLVGELVWHGSHPYVESLAADYRGRVHLVAAPDVGRNGDLVRVEIDGEDRAGLRGHVIGVVQGETILERAIRTQIDSLHIPDTWPTGMADAVAGLPKSVANRLPKGRVDLRQLPLVTIDGETAKDFDDAVYCEKDGRGWRLIVAIADVGHYVKQGGALDTEAADRGNSVYLPGTVVPMLPEALSNELCSLKPKVPRLAMVCDMRVSSTGRVRESVFYEALIRSWQRLTYTRVGAWIEGAALDVEDEVLASLDALHRCFKVLLNAREKRGALDFDSHECDLELKDGRAIAVKPVKRNDAHRLIEEAMIAANVCAAEFLEQHDALGLYRVHGQPDLLKVQMLRSAFALAGVHLEKEITPKAVQAALAQIEARPDAWIFQMLTLRTMQQAVYQPDNIGHFGLALTHYMHFTSPIRRYADLIVHRAIKAVLHGKQAPLDEHTLADIGVHISFTERRAESAERAVDNWLKCDLVGEHVGEEMAGRVGGVTEFGLFVELEGFYVQGLVHISELGQDYFRFHPHAMALVGDRSGQSFRLGDAVRVRVREVRPALGRIDLELVGNGGKRQQKKAGDDRQRKGGRRIRR
jgi:ribonuclease R